MSTKVGIIAEGVIDYTLLPALLGRIAQERANFTWPIDPDDLAEILPLRKKGHGGVLDSLKRIVGFLSSNPTDYAFFVILLDRDTRAVQRRVKRLIRGKSHFVLGIAIEEIEAWWLADRGNTLAWLGLQEVPRSPSNQRLKYWRQSYNAERDKAPKKTLDELTRIAPKLQEFYGAGNQQLALDFVEDYWNDHADLGAIEHECKQGFLPFCSDASAAFRTQLAREGRLVR